MVIKHLSRFGNSKPLLLYLLRYIFRDGKFIRNEDSKCKLLWTHNLVGRTIDGYASEFQKTAALRMRKSTPVVAHIILSFHPLDTPKLTDRVLKEICKEYTRLRGENCQFLFAVHRDRDSVHIHGCESINTLAGRSNRISHEKYALLKQKMTEFQLKYDLSHCLPCHGKKRQKILSAAKLHSYYKKVKEEQQKQLKQFQAIRSRAKAQSLERGGYELERGIQRNKSNQRFKKSSDELGMYSGQQYTWGLGLSP